MRALRITIVAVLVASTGAAGLLVGGAGPTPAAPEWAPAATATIHPGVQTFTGSGQCTANFVFTDGSEVYLGQAAHCAGTGGPTATNGCDSGSLPLGTPVTVWGATRPGVLVYSSWLAMQELGESDPATCQYNDLALVRLHPADVGRVNPSMPHWGGPVGLARSGPAVGSPVYSYGNSELRLGLDLLMPKSGLVLGGDDAGWSHEVLTITPGIPGDSGSGYLDSGGRALGVLSTLQILPVPALNGVGDLPLALDYLQAATSMNVQLVPGTEPFNPDQLPLGS